MDGSELGNQWGREQSGEAEVASCGVAEMTRCDDDLDV